MKKAILVANDDQKSLVGQLLGEDWDTIKPFQVLFGVHYSVLVLPAGLAANDHVRFWVRSESHRFSGKIVEVG